MDWRMQKRIEQRYQRELVALSRVFKPANPADPDAWKQILMDRARQMWFTERAMMSVRRMVAATKVQNARSWRAAALKGTRGRMIYKSLSQELEGPLGARVREIVRDNAELISTFPLQMSRRLDEFILDQANRGVRHETIARHLQKKFPGIVKSRITLIARTETSKCSTALTRARAEELNADWWVWRTSQDQRVRESHRKMNDILVNWHDLPSPEALIGEEPRLGKYAAGDCPNCRCYPEPLLRFDQVKWPHRCYHGGVVTTMSLAEFKQFHPSLGLVA